MGKGNNWEHQNQVLELKKISKSSATYSNEEVTVVVIVDCDTKLNSKMKLSDLLSLGFISYERIIKPKKKKWFELLREFGKNTKLDERELTKKDEL